MRASYPVVQIHVGIQGKIPLLLNVTRWGLEVRNAPIQFLEHMWTRSNSIFFLFCFAVCWNILPCDSHEKLCKWSKFRKKHCKTFSEYTQREISSKVKNVVINVIQKTDKTHHDHAVAFKHLHNGNFSYVTTQQPIDTGVKKSLDIILCKHEVESHLLK